MDPKQKMNSNDFTFSNLDEAKKVVQDLVTKFNEIKNAGSNDAEVKALKQQIDESNEKMNSLLAENRKKEIDLKVAACKLPAYRGFVREMFTMAYAAGNVQTVVKFKENDKENEISIVEYLDKFVAKLNDDSEKIFKTLSIDSDLNAHQDVVEGNPGEQVDKLTKKYMAENKTDDYSHAMAAVLSDNPELKDAYFKGLEG